MQLIWVAGPAGKVVKLSITTRTVALLVVGLATSLLLLGFVFHWVGWRVAIEYVPELAHRLGGVTSQSEQEKLEATYRAKLEHLDQQLLAVSEHLKKLEDTKNQVLGRVGLTKLLSLTAPDKADLGWGQGGPLNLLPRWGATQWQLDRQLDQSLHQAQRMEQSLAQVQTRWDQDLDRLRQVPTQLPVAGEFLLTSSFGYRLDPFTRLPSLHEGIDFVAPVGTPVLATAAGEVIRAEYAGAYGNLVELAHPLCAPEYHRRAAWRASGAACRAGHFGQHGSFNRPPFALRGALQGARDAPDQGPVGLGARLRPLTSQETPCST